MATPIALASVPSTVLASGRMKAVGEPTLTKWTDYEMQDIMENSGAYRFLTHEGTPIMYRENVVEPAVRPDGQPLYPFFKAV